MADAASIKENVRAAFRDFQIEGVPASGEYEPEKPLIRSVLADDLVDFVSEVGAAAAAGRRVYATTTERDTWTDRPVGAQAYVTATDQNYRWDGDSWEPFDDPSAEAAATATAEADRAEEAADSAMTTLQSRPLKTQVPGRPMPSVDVAFEIKNAAGEAVAQVMTWGEVISTGRPVLDSEHLWFQASPTGAKLWGVRQDGSMDFGPLNLRAPLADGGARLLSEDGGALAERTFHGVDPEAESYDAYVDDGQVYAWVRGGAIQLTADPAITYRKAEVRGGLLVLLRDSGERITTPLAGRYPDTFPASVTTIDYSDIYGQSNGAGNAAGLKTASTFHDRFLMFGAGQRAYGNLIGTSQERTTPLVASHDAVHDFVLGREHDVRGAGETSNSGYARVLLASSAVAATTAVLTTCSAIGSANMAMLRSDSSTSASTPSPINEPGTPWRNLVSRFRRAALFWRLQGRAFVAGPLRWSQGEGNYADTKANYLTSLQKIRDDWQALALEWNALRMSGGFPGKAPLITTQMCAGAKYTAPTSQDPWAQLQINLNDPTTALCAGPTYDQVYASDGVHLLALGQEMQGARQAVAYAEWLKGLQWHPLCVRSDGAFAPSRSGTTVTLKLWNHFDLPLVFDTTTITGLGADQGFRWADNGDGNAVTVTNAVIVNKNTIELTLSAVPTGTGGAIEIAMTGASGANSGPATGNRATLRTNGSGVTVDGRAVEHFICIDRVAVS